MKPGHINLSITYQEFEPGDIVTPTNSDGVLQFQELYEVEEFYKPVFGNYIQMYGMVFVKGEPCGIPGNQLVYCPGLTTADIAPKLLTQ